VQQSLGAVFRVRLGYGVSIAATPASARMQFPTALGVRSATSRCPRLADRRRGRRQKPSIS
jgi:hypothetical protein